MQRGGAVAVRSVHCLDAAGAGVAPASGCRPVRVVGAVHRCRARGRGAREVPQRPRLGGVAGHRHGGARRRVVGRRRHVGPHHGGASAGARVRPGPAPGAGGGPASRAAVPVAAAPPARSAPDRSRPRRAPPGSRAGDTAGAIGQWPTRARRRRRRDERRQPGHRRTGVAQRRWRRGARSHGGAHTPQAPVPDDRCRE